MNWVHGVLIMTLSVIPFLVLIIVHHLIAIFARTIHSAIGAAEKKFSINFSEAMINVFFEFALQWWY